MEQLGHIGPWSGAATAPGNRRLLAQGEQVGPRARPPGRAGVTYRGYPGAPGRTDEEADGAELAPRRVPDHHQLALDGDGEATIVPLSVVVATVRTPRGKAGSSPGNPRPNGWL